MRCGSVSAAGVPAVRSLVRVMGTITAAVALLAMAVPAAHAADHSLQVSRNGVEWVDGFSGSLFGTPTVVPGDRLVRSLHVRNSSDLDTTVWLSLVDNSAGSPLAEHLAVSAGPVGDLGTGVRLPDATADAPLMRPVELDAGDSIALQVAVEFGDVVSSRTQDGGASFDLVVRLADRPPATPAETAEDAEGAGTLLPSFDPTPSTDPSTAPSPGTGDPPSSAPWVAIRRSSPTVGHRGQGTP
jgi:hypothetical protein